ncbi:MAG: methylenetetrahydrofolate--tRNA-(uracil(54)-C(5))-methyltransferase (FADH(2)-oxidizing) TrmFO [Candidatus Izemoplasmataceae bacterium]
MKKVNIIGAGLAGSEAAYQLAKRGYKVNLYEMRPNKMTPAHHTDKFAELVCSNSLRGNHLNQAVGVMKEEMHRLDSLIVKTAYQHQVPAGSALAVDREGFSLAVTNTLKAMNNITIIHEEVTSINDEPTIIATGPLTSEGLMETIQAFLQDNSLYFYDAAAPIIEKDSINMDICYKKSRYDKGTADYINCPMDKETYERFYQALIHAECTEIKAFELKVFEGCMPIEEMAKRGEKTMLFGPLKPVGLAQDLNDKPYAVVQLRQDDARDTMYNIVGFQTHLKFPEQKRIIRMIPGLEKANIIRYGVMHKNAFINAPTNIKATYQSKLKDNIFFAGQLSGVEGYVESSASAIIASLNMIQYLENKPPLYFPVETIMGAQADYIANANKDHFQPMNANFGLLPELEGYVHKKERKEAFANRALKAMDNFIKSNQL